MVFWISHGNFSHFIINFISVLSLLSLLSGAVLGAKGPWFGFMFSINFLTLFSFFIVRFGFSRVCGEDIPFKAKYTKKHLIFRVYLTSRTSDRI